MAKDAWGRWGAADERGAANLIDPAKVGRTAALVRTGQVISLAQPLSSRTPVPQHRAPMIHLMGRDGGDYAVGARRPGGFQFAEDTIVIPTHIGTHIDALCHAWCDDELYNGFSANTIRSTTGARHCGIDKMNPIVTRGVLLDFVAAAGHPLPVDASLSASDIKGALEAAGTQLEPGDAVLIRTGWVENLIEGQKPDFNVEPGIDVGAAELLASSGVALVGADNFAIEAMPFPAGKVFPVHQRLIRDCGVALLEGAVLKPLAETGARIFCMMVAPLPIVGGTGSPVTPVAIL